jgi:hypothetical protein
MGRKSKFGESYKREAVARAEASGNVSQTTRELGISNRSLHALDQMIRPTAGYRQRQRVFQRSQEA